MSNDTIHISVAYAAPSRQQVISLDVPVGTTALEAVRRSGIQQLFRGVDLLQAPMGIFSRPLDGRVNPKPAEYRLEEGDRVEIYRPLLIDPKQARLRRAAKAKRNRKEPVQKR